MNENSDRILVVMGNGPSLKEIDFKIFNNPNVSTFGLNSAYRAYPEMDWYPDYFGCFDFVVTNHHSKDFYNIVVNSPIKKGFFISNIGNHDKIKTINLKRVSPNRFNDYDLPKTFDDFYDAGNSGSNACQVGYLLGYRKIVLVGVDANYVQQVDGAVQTHMGSLKMEKTPETNPNYWFDSYQQEGDEFNVPNPHIFQIPGWIGLSERAKRAGLEIINCSNKTKLTCFKKDKIENIIK